MGITKLKISKIETSESWFNVSIKAEYWKGSDESIKDLVDKVVKELHEITHESMIIEKNAETAEGGGV